MGDALIRHLMLGMDEVISDDRGHTRVLLGCTSPGVLELVDSVDIAMKYKE